jgi:conjugal transfer pilus assembly protein TraF
MLNLSCLFSKKGSPRKESRMRLKIISLLMGGVIPVLAQFYEDHSRGWHWYEKLEISPEKPHEMREDKTVLDAPLSKILTPTQRVKAFKKEWEARLHAAWVNPTPANLEAYITLQKELTDRAQRFSQAWMQTIYRNPFLDHTIQNPVNHRARHIYYDQQKERTGDQIRSLAKRYGLFVFIQRDCPYCTQFAPIIQAFVNTYGWKVLVIAVDGQPHEAYPKAVPDEGLAQQWGVTQVPAVYAVDPTSEHVIPVAVGLTSMDMMEQRLMALITEKTE